MTREEHYEKEFKDFIESNFWVDEAGDIGVAVAAAVFEYFESRNCGSCKYAAVDTWAAVCTNNESPMLADFVSERLWCDCFEREGNK